ncbi:MAG TPA: MFS transporter [Pyrinomonadaceae bacterium]|jgi:MFS family permease
MNPKTPSSNRLFYGWIIVALSTLALAVSNGLTTLGFPVFHFSIREDFVASGAVEAASAQSFIANGASLTFLVAGFASPIAGFLIQKFSLRALMTAGCVILGAGLILHARAGAAETVYLARILMGASLGFVGVLANTVLVSRWFRRRRGTAIGILLTGTSIGGVLIPLVAAPLIAAYGWRTALLAVSLLVWLVLLPAILFLVKDKPEDIGLLPDAEANELQVTNYELRDGSDEFEDTDKNRIAETEIQNPKSKTQSPDGGYTLRQALKMPLFWVFAICAALIFYPIFVISQQFILYLQSAKIGLSGQAAAFAQATLFAVSVGGKFLFGFLSDRFSPTRVMLGCCAVMFAASLVLLNLTAGTAFLFLIPFGLGYGGTFVLLNRLVADYFGTREYGKILGVIMVVETLGSTVGGKITASLADAAGGDYTQAFYVVILATGMALAAVVALNLMIGKKEIF